MNRRVGLALIAALAVAPALAAQGVHRISRRGLDSLRKATLVDSVDAESFYRYGRGLWERGKYNAADSAFQRALHLAPWHAGAHFAIGNLPFGRGGRYRFDLQQRLSPEALQTLDDLSAAHVRQAFLTDPLLDLTPLGFLELDDLVPPSGAVVCASGGCVETSRENPWPARLRRGVRPLVTGRPDSAYHILSAILNTRHDSETVPDDFIWYFALACDRAGHPGEARDAYRELAQRVGRRERSSLPTTAPLRDRALLLVLYAASAARAGDPALAVAALREAVVADFTAYQAHARMADILESEGDLTGALVEYHAALDAAPDSGLEAYRLGTALVRADRAAEARDVLLAATRQLPWNADVQLALFRAALAAEDRPTAGRALEAMELFAPRRLRPQVAEERRRFDRLSSR